jgi:methylthioribose-1-phosphate isomerase
LFGKGQIDLAIVGADRVTRNGDVANKIGTYGVACLCCMHQRPFYVAAPLSTVDLGTPTGESIHIEQRSEQEVTEWCGRRHVHPDVHAINPSFDVTPARLVTGLVTEVGVAAPLDANSLHRLAGQQAKSPE